MKKFLFSLFATGALFSTDVLKAQTVIFEDSFETYTDFAIANVGNWTLTDVDLKTTYGFQGITFPNTQVAKSFQVFNSTTTTPPMTPSETSDWTANTGDKMMVAFAATSSPWNNDWLISPQIQLVAGQGATLSFWAKSCDADYGAEKFKVLVSTTGTAVANFTAVSGVITTPSDATWHEYTYNLNAYAGQQIYVAIQCTSEDQFGFAVDDFKVVSIPPATTAPGCSTLSTPANAATGVAVTPSLTWAASSGADSYDVYLDTNPNPTTMVGSTSGTSFTVTSNLALNTTYYWKVIPKNSIGSASGCTVNSFTTTSTLTYCGPLAFTFTVEPITLVNFAGINNTTSASTTGGTAHEFFLNQVGNVTQGSTHTITIKGNTGGNYTNNFAVFIDWNQDGDFADAGETYSVGTIVNSTGTDTKQLTYDITVPVGATVGNTRMRVKKQFGTTSPLTDPCTGASFGQAEDYTLNVGVLAVNDITKSNIKSYPNPVKDVFNIEAQGKIKSVKVFDVTGKQLLTKDLNETKSQIDFSRFNAGVYVVTTQLEDGSTTSTKVIKK
ncbi:MAG: hypothetical protein BGO86_05180 [Chryseobacterium sp. 36-9]|nr:MAG: hypothetical protein BGO86_05180 [Chryseobacterium sp. 36-9]